MATPADIPGLIGWWKADDITGVINGGNVNPWNSNGTYGPDLDETAGTPPTLDTTVAINGINGVRFTAGRTLRDTTSLTGFTNGVGGASLYVVGKLDDASGAAARRGAVIATGAAGAGASRFAMSCVTGVPQWFCRRVDGIAGATVNGAESIGTAAAHILAGTIDYATTTQRLYVDGALVGSSTAALTAGVTTTDSTGVGIGSHPGNTAEGWPGWIKEVVLLDHAATPAENEALHGYLSGRHSIAVANYTRITPAVVAAAASIGAPAVTTGTAPPVDGPPAGWLAARRGTWPSRFRLPSRF